MYLFTFLFLFTLALLDISNGRYKYGQKRRYKFFFSIAILWLIFHDGLRWGVATDWYNYYEYFRTRLSNPVDEFEIGYRLFNTVVRFFTTDYTIFLLLHAIIVYLLLRSSIVKFSPFPFISLFLFYCLMLTYLGMNRQYIAFALAIFSYKYIIEKQFSRFLIVIILAAFFHVSVLIFLPAYFLKNHIPLKIVIILLLLVTIISFSNIINNIPTAFFDMIGGRAGVRLSYYYSLNENQGVNIINTLLSISKRLGLLVLVLLLFKSKERDVPAFNFFFNLYFVATLIYILFNNSFLQTIVARGLMYYNIAEIFLVPFILLKFKKGFSQYLLLILFACYGWLQIQKGFNYYKEVVGVDIFRPYNSALYDKKYDAMNNKK